MMLWEGLRERATGGGGKERLCQAKNQATGGGVHERQEGSLFLFRHTS